MIRILGMLMISVFSCISLMAQNPKVEILREAYAQKDWKAFVDNFPQTFVEFVDLYGCDLDKGPKPLYEGNKTHIFFIFSDDRIREKQYLEWLLKLTEGYMWEADAVNWLGYNIGLMIDSYPELISDFMKDKPDDLVKDFFKSAIANPHPVPDNTGYYTSLLEKIKLYEELSPRIVLLMMVAHSGWQSRQSPQHYLLVTGQNRTF